MLPKKPLTRLQKKPAKPSPQQKGIGGLPGSATLQPAPNSLLRQVQLAPASISPADAFLLHRTIGNRAVGRLSAGSRRPGSAAAGTRVGAAHVTPLPANSRNHIRRARGGGSHDIFFRSDEYSSSSSGRQPVLISRAPAPVIQRKGAEEHAWDAITWLDKVRAALKSGERIDGELLEEIPEPNKPALFDTNEKHLGYYLQEIARQIIQLARAVNTDTAPGKVTVRPGWIQPLEEIRSLFDKADARKAWYSRDPARLKIEQGLFDKTEILKQNAEQVAHSAEQIRQKRVNAVLDQPGHDVAPDTSAVLGNVGGLDQFFGGPSSLGDFTSKLATTQEVPTGETVITQHDGPSSSSGSAKANTKEELTGKGQDAASAAGALSAFGNVLGIGGNVAGLLGLVGNVRQLNAEWKEKSSLERMVDIGVISAKAVEQGVVGTSNVAGVAGNVGAAISAQGSNDSALSATTDLGVASDLVNDFMAGLRSLIEPFMDVYRLIKDLSNREWMSAAADLGHIVRHVINMGRFGVKVVKSLTHFVDALGPVSVALPFLSSGLAMVSQAWDFFEAAIKFGISLRRKIKLNKMSGAKAEEKLGVSGVDEDSTNYLRSVLDKRMHRNYLTAAVTSGKFFGEMEVMIGHGLNAGGYTAPAGLTLNIVGAATKLGSSAAGLGVKGRWRAKQMTHNYLGRRTEKGKEKNLLISAAETALWFDASAEKSKKAKAERRLIQTQKLMEAIERLSAGWPDDPSVLKERMKMDKPTKARYDHVRFIIKVTGVDYHKLIDNKKDKYKQVRMMFNALAKR